jgi:thiamine-phosphate pyrophosphorylase|tara:strand:- start:2 stop:577 length:576 start_codon:yes stop_codon:yes gene_type:complete
MHKKNLKAFCFISDYDRDYIKKLDKQIGIIVRNYKNPPDIKKLKELISFCKSTNRKVFLANQIRLALNLKFDGVYIPSFNKKINFIINKRTEDFIILGSAHNFKEIRIKEKQGVDIIFISPLFKVIKSNKFLGVCRFNTLAHTTIKKVVALGGIDDQNIKKLNILKANGFAGISYFKKKRPCKGPLKYFNL